MSVLQLRDLAQQLREAITRYRNGLVIVKQDRELFAQIMSSEEEPDLESIDSTPQENDPLAFLQATLLDFQQKFARLQEAVASNNYLAQQLAQL